MSAQKRDYDEELKALLAIAKEQSTLIDSSYAPCLGSEQVINLQWVTVHTSGEIENANS